MGKGKCEKLCMFDYALKTPLLYKVCDFEAVSP